MKRVLFFLAFSSIMNIVAFAQTLPFNEWWLNAYLTGVEVQYGLERKDYCGLSFRKLYISEYDKVKSGFINDKPFAIFSNFYGIDSIFVRMPDLTTFVMTTPKNARWVFALYKQGQLQIPIYMFHVEDKENNLVDVNKEKYTIRYNQ